MVDLEGLRKHSEALTRRKYRVEVGAAIHVQGGQDFTATTIQETAHLPANRVSDELSRLKEAGMIREVDDSDRAMHLKAEPHPFWVFCHDTAVLYGWSPT